MVSAQWGQRMLKLDRDVTFRLAVQHWVGMTQGNKGEPQLILNLWDPESYLANPWVNAAKALTGNINISKGSPSITQGEQEKSQDI